MNLISEGINQVRAFALAAGIAGDGTTVNSCRWVLVRWRSEHDDKLYQVYINGKFAGGATYLQQRSIVVPIRWSESSPSRIAVYAVDTSKANVDFSSELSSEVFSRAKISWPRFAFLPYEGLAEIYPVDAEGEIDYSERVNREAIRLWPSRQDKSGFGMSRFGVSDFGYDGSGCIGFGLGGFGEGEFGFDADEIEWTSEELAAGEYEFAVGIKDRFGVCAESAIKADEVTLIRSWTVTGQLQVESYDSDADRLVLCLS